jgi:glyoxylase-like metal-dependent hydrolase (beta-lactamase superfamily II)
VAPLPLSAIRQLHLADLTVGEAELCPVFAYVVLHPDGPFLFDTGIGAAHPGIDALYKPSRRPLVEALADEGLAPQDLRFVVNSHLHFDHCGGNPLFPGRPICAQRREYEAARAPAYTVPDSVDFPGACFELLDGDHEPLAGVRIVVTPGHTPGHQSMLIETDIGPIVLAGQAAYTAGEFDDPEGHAHPRGLDAAWDPLAYVESIRRLKELRPRRVYFAHEAAVWGLPLSR